MERRTVIDDPVVTEAMADLAAPEQSAAEGAVDSEAWENSAYDTMREQAATIKLADGMLEAIGPAHEWAFENISDGCECGLGISHPIHASATCRYAANRANIKA